MKNSSEVVVALRAAKFHAKNGVQLFLLENFARQPKKQNNLRNIEKNWEKLNKT